VLCALAAAAVACTGARPQLGPLAPGQYHAAGDTAVFGRGPLAMDETGSLMRFELREDACVLLARMDRQYAITLKEVRWMAAGVHDIPPWRPDADRGRFRRGHEALLVLVLGEDCTSYQPEADARSRVLSPDYALNSMAPGLLRRPDSPWAAYLVSPD
jgi:hypothetical protein